jgi:hypothetical protein
MGRPPIGKQAMSGAERQRRYLARLLGGKSGPSHDAKLVERLRAELAQAKARITDLESKLASAHQRIATLQATTSSHVPLHGRIVLPAKFKPYWRLIRAALHPNKPDDGKGLVHRDPEEQKRRHELWLAWERIKPEFLPPLKHPEPPPLPETVEDMERERWRTTQARKAKRAAHRKGHSTAKGVAKGR